MEVTHGRPNLRTIEETCEMNIFSCLNGKKKELFLVSNYKKFQIILSYVIIFNTLHFLILTNFFS